MTKSDQIKILNDKIKANNAQYKIDRLNAEISAFSEGDLDKYEFLTRKDLKYKPNALGKAKFEFSPMGKAFNQGLDKKAENYKEESVIKLLKDIRDRMVRPIGGNNDNRNNGGDDDGDDVDDGDDGDDNKNNDDNDDGDDEYADEYLLKLKNDKSEEKTEELEAEELEAGELEAEELEAEELNKRFNKLKNKKNIRSRKIRKKI